MSMGKKIKGLFWSSGASEEKTSDEDGLSDEEIAALAAEADAKGAKPGAAPPGPMPSPPSGEARASPPEGSRVGKDFATIYAEDGASGNPQADQVLVTYESLKGSTPAAALTTVLTAMMSGIKADPQSIHETLNGRIRCLQAVVAAEREGAASRAADRNARLAEGTTQVNAQIEQKRREIAELEAKLASTTQAVQTKNAEEQGLVAAFEQNATAEANRLQDLIKVLPPVPAAAIPEKK